MNNRIIVSLASVAVLSAAGCSTVPERIEALESAQAVVHEVDRHPMAGKVAGTELEKAKAELQAAEQARESSGDLEDIRHHAYLAEQHALIAKERIGEAEAASGIAKAESERTAVLLEAEKRKVNQAEAEAMQAKRKANRAERKAEVREREAAMALQVADQAMEEARRLEQELEELQAEQTARGIVLTLGDVLFDTDEAELKPGAEKAIGRLAAFLADNPERHLVIEGHTDSRGDDSYNQQLSMQRAQAVRTALVERGISAERLRSVGLGEQYPVATNETIDGRQQNRRVEIVVSSQDGTFPDAAYRTAANH